MLINSGAGLRANAGWGSYAASKFALRAFGDALRLEEPALRVTSIHPGRIDTDMQRDIVAGEGDEVRPGALPESLHCGACRTHCRRNTVRRTPHGDRASTYRR